MGEGTLELMREGFFLVVGSIPPCSFNGHKSFFEKHPQGHYAKMHPLHLHI
jgi:hypothetical protein